MTTDELRKLAPHMSVLDLNAPRNVASNLSMPKPVVSTIAHWMHDETSNHDLPDGEMERIIQEALMQYAA